MIFTEREKSVYGPPDGGRFDPVAVYHKLVQTTGGRLDDLLAVWWGEEVSEQEKAFAATQLVTATRASFGFLPFEAEGGKLDGEVLETLYHFLEWLQKKD